MIKSVSREQLHALRQRLATLYGREADRLLERFFMMIGRYGVGAYHRFEARGWDQRDSVLITYADGIRDAGGEDAPLRALRAFAGRHLKGAVGAVHLLPFYPWSSDDGFSVVDYRAVAPEYGDWADVEALGRDFGLMFDLVLNHCSTWSCWFNDFVAGIEPARHYFLPMDPKGDHSAVVRPRTSPLLTKTRTRDGDAHVWTTFSPDQVDLNWRNPEVLFEFLDILFFYLSKGMRVARLDAVAFLWKEPGTDCIHRPQTHEIVKLFRGVLDAVAPGARLLTETNVPHGENIAYFGEGDEAHMVYQFSLPPLVLHAFATGDASHLTRWALALAPPPPGCTFFNFTASHDGIGLRPVEGLLPAEAIDALIRHVERAGGRVSRRTLPDGSTAPYELNVSYYSALADPDDPELGVERFLASQALALSLRGIPGVYLHSLTATPNHHAGVDATGMNRAINRRKWRTDELEAHLRTPTAERIFARYLRMLRRRANHAAFHPDAEQRVFDLDPALFVHSRIAPNQEETLLCAYNCGPTEKRLPDPAAAGILPRARRFYDILSGKTHGSEKNGIRLAPYQALWLAPRG